MYYGLDNSGNSSHNFYVTGTARCTISATQVSITHSTASTSTSTGALVVPNGGIGVGGAAYIGGITVLAAATTGASSLRILSGTAPTSPVDGDMWYDGTNVKFRVGGTTKTFTLT
jgi:hypothetical protein